MHTTTWTLVTAVACTACMAQPPRPASNGADGLLAPVRLPAGSELIDVGECVAHAGPHLMDLDEDGLTDLLVGDFVGHMHYYQNLGTNQAPVYSPGQKLEANGEVIEIPNW